MEDGAIDMVTVNVIAVVPYLIMKTAALDRGKTKDAYDIYFVVKHYVGGATGLAKEFAAVHQGMLPDSFFSTRYWGLILYAFLFTYVVMIC